MTPIPSIDESKSAIQREIGLDLSYFYDDDVPHFDPMSVAAGVATALLISFLMGVYEGLKEEAEEAGKGLAHLLGRKLKELFYNDGSSNSLDEEVHDIANQTRSVAQDVEEDVIVRNITITEERLVDFLIEDRGLPRRDAVRISHTTRIETQRQLGMASNEG
jgi:hypothetical protein